MEFWAEEFFFGLYIVWKFTAYPVYEIHGLNYFDNSRAEHLHTVLEIYSTYSFGNLLHIQFMKLTGWTILEWRAEQLCTGYIFVWRFTDCFYIDGLINLCNSLAVYSRTVCSRAAFKGWAVHNSWPGEIVVFKGALIVQEGTFIFSYIQCQNLSNRNTQERVVQQ